jgi:hypothetical protein
MSLLAYVRLKSLNAGGKDVSFKVYARNCREEAHWK